MLSIALMIMLAGVRPPHPADVAGLFKADDYPQSAVEANEQGVTKVRASIALDGTPTGCRIVKSSRSASLDAATCQILMQRGRFMETAKLHHGKPFQIEWSVGWKMSQADPRPFDVDMDRVIYTLEDGRITGCRSEVAAWRPAYPAACDDFRNVADADIASLPKERAVPGRDYVLESMMIPGDHRWDNDLGKSEFNEVMGQDSVVLTINAEGMVVNCEKGENELRTAAEMTQWCEATRVERFAPLEAAADNRNPRKITRIGVAYFRPAEMPSTRQ